MAVEFTASAPGKLVIAGEYAVLDGVPAISAAVNKRASATVRIAAPGDMHIVNTGAYFAYDLDPAGLPIWRNDPGEFGRVFTATLRALAQRLPLSSAQRPWQMQLSTADFYVYAPDGTTQKLGIGSSAAICVALTAALQSSIRQAPEFARCLAAHRELQHGAGSGIDVATGWYGGVLLMQLVEGAVPSVERLHWPEGFFVRPVWTGIPAATTTLLQRLEVFRYESGKSYSRMLQQCSDSLQHIRLHWHAGDVAELVDGLSHYGELLAELDEMAAIGIWSEPHLALQALASSMDVGYKPSGAGGGDFGLAFSGDQVRLEAFIREVHTRLVPQSHGVEWAADGLLVNGRAITG